MRISAAAFSIWPALGVPAVCACLAAPGCRAVITPPANPIDPATVYLVDEGRHAALVLPRDDGSMVQYAYGQWAWYALGKNEWWRAPLVVAVPSTGTLGRRELGPVPTQDDLAQAVWAEAIIELRVDRAHATSLMTELDARFNRGIDTLHENPMYGLGFVKDDEAYWMFHHCNSETVQWLRALGCRVSGTPVQADFALRAE